VYNVWKRVQLRPKTFKIWPPNCGSRRDIHIALTARGFRLSVFERQQKENHMHTSLLSSWCRRPLHCWDTHYQIFKTLLSKKILVNSTLKPSRLQYTVALPKHMTARNQGNAAVVLGGACGLGFGVVVPLWTASTFTVPTSGPRSRARCRVGVE